MRTTSVDATGPGGKRFEDARTRRRNSRWRLGDGLQGSVDVQTVKLAAPLSDPYAEAAVARTISAHFSPIMMEGALVFPDVKVGMMEASATRNPVMPCTRN